MSCPTNGLVPKDAYYSNLTVTETAALCNLSAKTISNTSGTTSSTVYIASPLIGDGSSIDPITVKDGSVSTIPQYLLWDGTLWDATELQELERSDNILTISNSTSPVNLSSLTSLLTSTTASKLVLSASSSLNDQAVISYDNADRTYTIDAPDGNDLDGTPVTATGGSITINAGTSGSNGATFGGDVTISAGQSTTQPGTVTIHGGDQTNPSFSIGDIYLISGQTPSTYISSNVLIGDIDTTTVAHFGSGGTHSILDSKSVPGYTVAGPSSNTDMVGSVTLRFIGGGGASQVAGTALLRVSFSRPFSQNPRTVILLSKNATASNSGLYATAITVTEFEVALTNYWVTNTGESAWKNSNATLAPFAYNPGGGDVITGAWPGPVEFLYLVVM